jgi:hypothetical protein
MRRRALLALAGSVFTTGGCLAGPPGQDVETGTPNRPDDDTASPTDQSPTEAEPTLVETSFEESGTCDAPSTATITAGTDSITVTGCLEGADGCTVASLEAVLFDTANESVSVVVGTDDQGSAEVACSQALATRAYEVSVTFVGDLPETVTVVHDDVRGRREVASSVTDR